MNPYSYFLSSWEEAKIKDLQSGLEIRMEENLPPLKCKKAVFEPEPGEAWSRTGAGSPPWSLETVQVPGGMLALYQTLQRVYTCKAILIFLFTIVDSSVKTY